MPAFVARALGYQEEIHSLWRSDAPRLDFITAHLDPSPGARLADIGANTGYFTLNLAERYPDCRAVAYEMNPRHAEFIRLTATAFALNNAEVQTQSCNLVGLDALPDYDVVLLLNVLHHAGFDFDPQVADHNAAFAAHAVAYLSKLRRRARRLVFQIGSNRGGDKARPVHPRDDDAARLAWNADPTFGDGSLASLMGSFETARPSGSPAQALAYYDEALRLGQGRNAGAFVAKAEGIAQPAGDKAAFLALLNAAVAVKDAPGSALALANEVMRRRAAWLIDSADDLF